MPSPVTPPIRWPAEAIWEAVAPTLPGFTVEILPEIDSTNSELMRRLRGRTGQPPLLEPTLLVAEQQTAGRGRLGRSWQSVRGDSLTFSLSMPLQPADWSGLSLVVGISLADSLEPDPSSPPRIGLKWPNDLWLMGPHGERKLAGILVETASTEDCRQVVIGVGINIREVVISGTTGTSSAVAALPGAGLHELHPGLDAAQVLQRVLPPLVQAVQAFEQGGFAPFQARFARRDVLSGRAVLLSGGEGGAQAIEGTAHGVGNNGALRVRTVAGMQDITSSEVSVRPVGGAPTPRPQESTGPC